MLKNCLIAILIIISAASFSQADIYNCNGVITNSPCGSSSAESTPIMKENASPPLSEEDKENKQKMSSLYSFDAYRLASQTEFGITVDFGAIKSICLKSTLAECEKLLQERRQYIEDQKLKVSEYRDKKSKDEEKANSQDNNTDVTIVNDNSLTINRRGYNRGIIIPTYDPYWPHRNDPPNLYWTPDYSGQRPIPVTPGFEQGKPTDMNKNRIR